MTRTPMCLPERLVRLAGKSPADRWAAIKETLRLTLGITADARERRHLHGLMTGRYALPRVLHSGEKVYIAYRPDADVIFSLHPEINQLSEKWIKNNRDNNAGDLVRLYALIFNVKQIIEDGVAGDMAELGVFRGNSAAVLAHYARRHGRRLALFDTFEGFDPKDLASGEESRAGAFADTSLADVRDLVGDEAVRFVRGRFPESIPDELHRSQFCLVHIDCDLYEPARAGLEFFYPRLSPGGLLIMHDYSNPHWAGIKRAVDEFCRGIPERPVILADKSGTAMIRKAAGR